MFLYARFSFWCASKGLTHIRRQLRSPAVLWSRLGARTWRVPVGNKLNHDYFSLPFSPAATRMIANALSHDSPPTTPARRPDNRLSVTVSNVQANKSGKAGRYHDSFLLPHQWHVSCPPGAVILMYTPLCLSVVSQPADEGNGLPAVKRRRVTAEMEGKYIINMPKGTTPRTRRILAQQAKKGRPDPVASPATRSNDAVAHHS